MNRAEGAALRPGDRVKVNFETGVTRRGVVKIGNSPNEAFVVVDVSDDFDESVFWAYPGPREMGFWLPVSRLEADV